MIVRVMKTLSQPDLAIIRAVLLVSGVPENEHAAHLEADFYTRHRTRRAMRSYRQIFGSLSRREVGK